MEIKWIEKMKLYLEYRKLKKMTDGALLEELEKKLEAEKMAHIPNIVSLVEDEEKKLEVAKDLIETSEINMTTKKKVIDQLPHKTQKELFRKSIKTKELLAQRDISTFLKILVKDKNLHPYDELYYRIDKAFSDSQLVYMLDTLRAKRPEAYEEEKVMGIIGKQIAVNMKKYETFLPSHLLQLTDEVIINRGEKEERIFDILREEDREKLEQSIQEAIQELKENTKNSMSEVEEQRLSQENIDKQISKFLTFAQKRQEELIAQGLQQAGERR